MSVKSTFDLFRYDLDNPNEPFDPQSIRLSQVGDCVRKHALRITGHAGYGYSEDDQSTWQIGHIWSDVAFRRWDREYPGEVEREVIVDPGPGFEGVDAGHIDLWIKPLNHFVEVKTTKSTSLRFLPHPAYVAQCQAYLHFHGRHVGATMELAYFFKDKLPPMSIPIVYDPQAGAVIEETLRHLLEYKRTGTLPPIPSEMHENMFPCNWGRGRCAMYGWCWG